MRVKDSLSDFFFFFTVFEKRLEKHDKHTSSQTRPAMGREPGLKQGRAASGPWHRGLCPGRAPLGPATVRSGLLRRAARSAHQAS